MHTLLQEALSTLAVKEKKMFISSQELDFVAIFIGAIKRTGKFEKTCHQRRT